MTGTAKLTSIRRSVFGRANYGCYDEFLVAHQDVRDLFLETFNGDQTLNEAVTLAGQKRYDELLQKYGDAKRQHDVAMQGLRDQHQDVVEQLKTKFESDRRELRREGKRDEEASDKKFEGRLEELNELNAEIEPSL